MERSTTVDKTSSVTVSLPQTMNNIYLRPGIGTNIQQTLNRNVAIDDSAEISIFDAEKYFNELSVLEAPKPASIIGLSGGGGGGGGGGNRVTPAENISAVLEPQRFSSASSSVDGYSNFYRNYRTRSFRSAATPTASSEASWNSQTGLLSVPPGSMAVSVRNPAPHDKKARSALSPSPPPPTPTTLGWRLGLRKKCPCSCKKSVQVKDKSVRRKHENSLPPPPPHMILRSSSKSSSTTSSSMADMRLTSNNNSTSISMEKVRHDSFQENWYQSRRSQTTSRDTRSFSSASTENIINPPKLQAMGIRTSFTDQRVGHGISATTGTNNGTNPSGFTFPILGVNPGIKLKDPAMAAIGCNKSTDCQADQDPARDSLEIFRPSHENPSSRKSSDHFMRLDRGAHIAFPGSPNSRAKSGNADVIDDGASDASSDLFEIESFSTAQTTTTATTATTTAHTPAVAMFLFRREAIEEAGGGGGGGGGAGSSSSSFQGLRGGRFAANPVMGLYEQHRRASLDEPMTPTTECCYEPSEASIDWSVTTAEGFDRASVANASEADYGEFTEPTAPPAAAEKSRRRSSGNGLLMSCRCEKAVSVGRPVPRPVKPVGPASGGYAGEHGRQVGPGISLSSSSTLGMWAVGHKL